MKIAYNRRDFPTILKIERNFSNLQYVKYLFLSGLYYLIFIFSHMKVAAFTFVRNIVQYGYPIVKSIHSILPLCDAYFVSVDDSTDDTLRLIQFHIRSENTYYSFRLE